MFEITLSYSGSTLFGECPEIISILYFINVSRLLRYFGQDFVSCKISNDSFTL